MSRKVAAPYRLMELMLLSTVCRSSHLVDGRYESYCAVIYFSSTAEKHMQSIQQQNFLETVCHCIRLSPPYPAKAGAQLSGKGKGQLIVNYANRNWKPKLAIPQRPKSLFLDSVVEKGHSRICRSSGGES
jgi:hypothetical protein